MKIFLYILLIINILVISYSFFVTIATSFIYAMIVLGLGILQLIPIVAIIWCIDNIEDLQYRNTKLLYRIKELEEEINPSHTNDVFSPITTNTETAKATWECVKCGTVNKSNTTCCSNCKSPYSSLINPTDNPFAKKKISRWVKFK